MTNQEAIEYLKGQIKCLKCETGIDCEKCIMPNWSKEIEIEALNKGIEALEKQETGHWIGIDADTRGYCSCFECSNCKGYIYPHILLKELDYEYCPNCGTKMKGENNPDCRNCDKWKTCENGEKGHANGTSIGYSIGECRDYVELKGE